MKGKLSVLFPISIARFLYAERGTSSAEHTASYFPSIWTGILYQRTCSDTEGGTPELRYLRKPESR